MNRSFNSIHNHTYLKLSKSGFPNCRHCQYLLIANSNLSRKHSHTWVSFCKRDCQSVQNKKKNALQVPAGRRLWPLQAVFSHHDLLNSKNHFRKQSLRSWMTNFSESNSITLTDSRITVDNDKDTTFTMSMQQFIGHLPSLKRIVETRNVKMPVCEDFLDRFCPKKMEIWCDRWQAVQTNRHL